MTEKAMSDMNDNTLRKIKKVASILRREKPSAKGLIDFYEKIFFLQYEIEPSIEKDFSFLTSKKSFPLIKRKDFAVDLSLSEDLFKKICDACSGNPMNPDPSAKAIKNSLGAGDLSFESMVNDYLANESPTPQYSNPGNGFNPELFDFILYNALKPSIVKSSHLISEYCSKTTSLTNARCPVCNGAPALSIASGKKYSRSLVCSFCWHEYKIKKSECPFCKNNDPQTLGHISLEAEKGIRADYCNSCKKYIKTINLKEYRKDFYLPLEMIVSIPFDMKMNEEGFKPE